MQQINFWKVGPLELKNEKIKNNNKTNFFLKKRII